MAVGFFFMAAEKVKAFAVGCVSAYDTHLSWAAVRLPGCRLDTAKYKEKILARHSGCRLTPQDQKALANRIVVSHALRAALISLVCTLPDSLLCVLLFVAVDIVQFEYHVFLAAQKLMVIYNRDGELIGGLPPQQLAQSLKKVMLLKMLGPLATRLAKQSMGFATRKFIVLFKPFRFFVQKVLRHLLKFVGVESAPSALTYSLNFLCGLISASITVWLFVPMMRNLETALRDHRSGDFL